MESIRHTVEARNSQDHFQPWNIPIPYLIRRRWDRFAFRILLSTRKGTKCSALCVLLPTRKPVDTEFSISMIEEKIASSALLP